MIEMKFLTPSERVPRLRYPAIVPRIPGLEMLGIHHQHAVMCHLLRNPAGVLRCNIIPPFPVVVRASKDQRSHSANVLI